jgi:hypothetical protein
MWEPQPLTPLWAFTACYRDSFALPHLTQLTVKSYKWDASHRLRNICLEEMVSAEVVCQIRTLSKLPDPSFFGWHQSIIITSIRFIVNNWDFISIREFHWQLDQLLIVGHWSCWPSDTKLNWQRYFPFPPVHVVIIPCINMQPHINSNYLKCNKSVKS